MTKLFIPNHLINLIYLYDNTYYLKFNKCISQIKNKRDLPYWSISFNYKNINYKIINKKKYKMNYFTALHICKSLNNDLFKYNRYNHGIENNLDYVPKFIGD